MKEGLNMKNDNGIKKRYKAAGSRIIFRRFTAGLLTLCLLFGLVVYSPTMLFGLDESDSNETVTESVTPDYPTEPTEPESPEEPEDYPTEPTEPEYPAEPTEPSECDEDCECEDEELPKSELPGGVTGLGISIIFPGNDDERLYIEEGSEFDLLYGVQAINEDGYELEEIVVIILDDGGFYESNHIVGSVYTVIYAAENIWTSDVVATRVRFITIVEEGEAPIEENSRIEITFPEDRYDMEMFYIDLGFDEDEYGELIVQYDLMAGVFAVYFEDEEAEGAIVPVVILDDGGFDPNAEAGVYFTVTYVAVNPYTDEEVVRHRTVAPQQFEDIMSLNADRVVWRTLNVSTVAQLTNAFNNAQLNNPVFGANQWGQRTNSAHYLQINLMGDLTLNNTSFTVNNNNGGRKIIINGGGHTLTAIGQTGSGLRNLFIADGNNTSLVMQNVTVRRSPTAPQPGINGQHTVRAFYLPRGGTLTIEDNVTIEGFITTHWNDTGYPERGAAILARTHDNLIPIGMANRSRVIINGQNVHIRNNEARNPDIERPGAAIALDNADLIMNGGQIYGNQGGFGAGVGLYRSSSFTMNDGIIRNNTALGRTGGGGVSVRQGSVFTMNGGRIHNNHATSIEEDAFGGGGLTLYFGGRAYINNGARIHNNFAQASGGGISTTSGGVGDQSGHLVINGGRVDNNETNGNGGGIAVFGNQASLTMHSGSIDNNKAEARGGGISIDSTATITLNGGSVSNNTALNGGGLGAPTVNQLTNTTIEPAVSFSGNRATYGRFFSSFAYRDFGAHIRPGTVTLQPHAFNNYDITPVLESTGIPHELTVINGVVYSSNIPPNEINNNWYYGNTQITVRANVVNGSRFNAAGEFFTGWTLPEGQSRSVYSMFEMPNEPTTVTANFVQAAQLRTVTFNPNFNGASPIVFDVLTNSTVGQNFSGANGSPAPIPTLDGQRGADWSFEGWSLNGTLYTIEEFYQLEALTVTENITLTAVWKSNFSFSIATLNFGTLRVTIEMLLNSIIVFLGGDQFTEQDTQPSDTAITFTSITDTGWSIGVQALQRGGSDFYRMLRVNGDESIYGSPRTIYTHESGYGEAELSWEALGFGIQVPNDTSIGGEHEAQLLWIHEPVVHDINP